MQCEWVFCVLWCGATWHTRHTHIVFGGVAHIRVWVDFARMLIDYLRIERNVREWVRANRERRVKRSAWELCVHTAQTPANQRAHTHTQRQICAVSVEIHHPRLVVARFVCWCVCLVFISHCLKCRSSGVSSSSNNIPMLNRGRK